MFEAATGLLGWSPRCFWRSTYWEYSHALVGHMKVNGKGKWGQDGINHWNNNDYQEAKEELAEVNSNRYSAADVPAEVKAELKRRKAERRALKSD